MNKKDLFSKGVIGLTASSVIVASCTNEAVWMDFDESKDTASQFSDDGVQALNIQITKEEAEYLKFLNNLGADIIKEPVVAREFAKDPSAFIKQYGYNGKVNLDEGMLKLILALGDEDINTAVNQSDISTTIALMESKGFLEDISNSYMNINLSDDDIKQIYQKMGIDPNNVTIGEKKGLKLALAVWPVWALVAAYEMVAAVYTAAVFINGGVALNIYAAVEVYSENQNDDQIDNTIMQNLPLRVWSLKGQEANTYIAADKYVTNQAQKLMKFFKEKDPMTFENIDEKQLEQMLKLSITSAPIKK